MKKEINKDISKTKVKQKIGLVLLGIIIGLILIEVMLNLTSLIIYSLQRTDFKIYKNELNIKEYRILTLGESTTAELYNGESSWPSELEKILNNRSKNIKFIVFNEGIPATQSAFILAKLQENIEKYHPDMVISMMGINDGDKIYFKDKPIQKIKIIRLYNWVSDSLKKRICENKRKNRNFAYCPREFLSNESKNKLNYIDNIIESYDLEKAKKELAYFEFSEKESCNKNEALGDLYMKMSVMYSVSDSYQELEQYKKAAKFYEKLLEYQPYNWEYCFILAHIYNKIAMLNDENEYKIKAIETFNIGLKLSKGCTISEWVYPEYKQIIESVDENIQYSPYPIPYYTIDYNYILNKEEILKEHYQEMYKILKANKIRHAAMQYPRRPISEIKEYFKDYPDSENIIYISNEDNFNRALLNYSFNELFIDNQYFDGLFGHCTERGNILIAENVADSVLESIKTEVS